MKALLFILMIAATATASAEITTKTVSYEHAGTQFQGYLAYDSSVTPEAKRPGVLVIPEWWGITDYIKGRAKQLASMGYVAFVADMYGNGMSTTDAKEAKELAGKLYGSPEMAARAQAGLDQLLKSGLADSSKVAAIGFCFGGTACQMLAYSGAPIAGLVSFHGGLMPPSPEQVKNIHCKVLMLNGSIDPNIKPDAIIAFEKALDNGHIDYQFINYSGALHAFTNPGATEMAKKNGMEGVIGYNETAARRSWAQMKTFFDEIFEQNPSRS